MAQLLVMAVFGKYYCGSTYLNKNENQIIGDKNINKNLEKVGGLYG